MQMAELVLNARTEGLLKGKKALEDTAKAGANTDKAVRGVDGRFKKAGDTAGQAAPKIKDFADQSDRTRGIAIAATKALAGLAASYATFQGMSASIGLARDFNAALAETSTLIEGTPEQLEAVTSAAREMSREFGGTATQQVKAYYQALSAGADGVAGATKLLDQANRLAIGGVTDVTTGVDALTTAMNAYGPEVLSAAEASDAMFVAMRAGKTTIGELSGSLGQIVPIASSAGVSFDEVTAGIAALTTQGLSTSAATTGLRQVLASVIAPTKQATDQAAALGIAFDVQALKAQGLAGFLEEVIVKTGGNEAAMAQLFGSVEALGAALAFAGGAGDSFSRIMDDMTVKAGATDAAYQKMADSLDQRWSRLTAAATDIALGFGNALLAVVVPAMEAMAAASVLVSSNLDVIGVGVLALAATQLPALVLSLRAATAGLTLIQAQFIAGAVAARGMAVAAGAARAAIALLGGPLGIVLGLTTAAAGAFLIFRDNAGEAEDGAYDAAAGTAALMGELDALADDAAPTASAAVIALANNNVKLADSAYEAAKAELARRRAYAEGAAANFAPGPTRRSAEFWEGKAAAELEKQERALEQAIRDRNVASEQIVMTQPVLTEQTENGTSASEDAASAALELAKQLSGLGRSGGSAAKATKALDKVADAMPVSETEAFNKALEDAGMTAEDFGVAKANVLLGGIDGVANAWGDFVSRGFRDFEGFKDAILNSFTSMLSQMIAMAARNRILIGIGATGGGIAGAAQAAGGGGGILGGVLGGGGSGGGLLGGLLGGSAGGSLVGVGPLGALVGGVGNTIGATLGAGGGLGMGLASVGGQISAAIAAPTVTSIMGAVGAALPVVGAIAGVASLLKGAFSQTYLSTDVVGTLTPDGLTGARQEEHYKGSTFRSGKIVYSEFPDDLRGALNDATDQVASETMRMAETIGLSASRMEGFEGMHFGYSFREGHTEEKLQQYLEQVTRDFADGLADTVLGSSAWAKADETASQTLERLSTSLQGVNAVFDVLGHRLLDVSLRGADAASKLVDLMGGLAAFDQATTTYFQAFYTEQERLDVALRQLSDSFADLGLAMPGTREAFRQLVEAQDTTTESGREMYAALVQMAGAMDQVLPSVANFTRDMMQLVGGITTDVDGMIAQASAAQRESAQAATLWYRTSQTLRGFIVDLRGTAGALVTGQQAQAFNEARFQSLLGAAVAGDNEAAGDLPNAARALLKSSQAQARTRVEQARMEARVLADLGLAAGVADVEGARHDVVAGLLGEQVTLLENVRDYLTGGGALDPAQIDALNAELGALQGAIKAAEMINYAFLRDRLDVTVDLLATADLPADVRRLIANAQDGVSGTIDFVVRSDLTPDQKWLALTGASELIKTLDFALGQDVDHGTRVIALASVSSLDKAINLLAGSDVSDELRRIALAGNSELARVVNVALASDADPQAIQLALGNVGSYAVAVQAALSAADDVQQIVFGDVGSYAAMVEAAFTQDLSADMRRVLLEQQGVYAVNVLGILGADLNAQMKALLLEANTTAVRGVTVSMAFGDTVSEAERDLLTQKGTDVIRTISAVVDRAGIGPLGALFLDQLTAGPEPVTKTMLGETQLLGMDPDKLLMLRARTGAIKRTLNGKVNLDSLDRAQRSMLEAVEGDSEGTLHLVGSFEFDPSANFSAWFGDTTRSNIAAPMDSLRGALGQLSSAIRRQSAEAAAAAAAARKAAAREEQARRAAAEAREAAAREEQAKRAAAEAAAAAAAEEAPYLKPFYRLGKIYRDGSAPLPPGYASGGMHAGGLRIVGENGPELEATGPARIYSAPQTRQIMGGDQTEVVRAVKDLKAEVARLREENRQLGMAVATNTKRTADKLRKFDIDGLPPERT